MSTASSCTPALNGGLGLPPYTSSPLKRTASPFTDPRTPPCSPKNTEQIWDEYERCARERSKSRKASFSSLHLRALESQRFSNGTVLDIIKSYDPYSSPKAPASSPSSSVAPSPRIEAPPSFSQRKNTLQGTSLSRTVCEACENSAISPSTICEDCKPKTIAPTSILHIEDVPSQLNTEQLTSSAAYVSKRQKHHTPSNSRSSEASTSKSIQTSQKRSAKTNQCTLPIRLSSLDHSRTHDRSSEPPVLHQDLPSSKISTPAPRIPRKPVPQPTTPVGCSFPLLSPTFNHSSITSPPPSTPPSTASSRHSPNSLLASSPEYHLSLYPSTPTTVCTTRMSTSASTPLHRASYSLQNTVSVWEDDDDEKFGLVDYLRRGWRGSRSSFGFVGRRESGSTTGAGVDVILEREVDGKMRQRGRWRKWTRCGCFGCKDD
ncbi:uncharacterized protein BDZ99DRAFT_470486 [Mytilinidion resinicola]|uniref:Uncharacterized protein n=1 Tax=Mytilinidion resinicola TaxID=574789 RepID=A0A6A6Z9K4_9PEZI|nr:uncharacterized protein BDZ99DRAFT_470486 [Mytilinidion resinicola]KAF2817488.1 hypothetical protein BDZ99DRAFT_470486 [Mytilinidion resinicola]